MDRIISFLLFSAFFYFMMHFGYGSHMVHGHHHEGHQGTGHGAGRSTKDPICGMEVEAGRGYTEVFSGHVSIASARANVLTDSTRTLSSSPMRRRVE